MSPHHRPLIAAAILMRKDETGSWGPIPANQAQVHYQGPVFRLNRYSQDATFRVLKAALTGGSTDIWDWNERADIDLATWRSLGKL
jgi:hypothetical protein